MKEGVTPTEWRRVLIRGSILGVLAALTVASVMLILRTRSVPPTPPQILGTVPQFSLVERSGNVVDKSDLLGRPWIASFVFTRCASACPRITSRMMSLRAQRRQAGGIQLVSVSVDPDHDSPEVLADFAASYGISGPDWLFLTGSRADIVDFVTGGFKLGLDFDPPVEQMNPLEPILHSTRLALVDGDGEIRGYYDAFDDSDIEHLLADLAAIDGS